MGSQSGRTVLVTGANSGIGLETARAFARRGAHLLLACRDPAKGEAARRELTAGAVPGTVTVVRCDLASRQSVAEAAAQVTDSTQQLDVLVANAAVMGGPFELTVDGLERQLATNHLGHFALLARLWPLLLAGDDPRVVVVSSIAARRGRLGPGLTAERLTLPQPYEANRVYADSKQANLLFAQELHRRAQRSQSGVRVLAAHPGVSATNLAPRQLRESGFGLLASLSRPVMRLVLQSAAAGAAPLLRAATDPRLPSGAFVGPRAFGQTRGRPHVLAVYPSGRDEATAATLWRLSEQITGTEFGV